MTDTPPRTRGPLYSPADRDNLLWFWRTYLRKHSGRLALVLLMIVIQGLVYQQFLSMTESGLRVIFESGTMTQLVTVCAFVFILFAVRGLMSFLVPVLSIRISNSAIYELREDLISHLLTLDLAYFERTKSGQIIQNVVGQTQALGGDRK